MTWQDFFLVPTKARGLRGWQLPCSMVVLISLSMSLECKPSDISGHGLIPILIILANLINLYCFVNFIPQFSTDHRVFQLQPYIGDQPSKVNTK